MVDENLTWSEHINTIAKKVSSAIAGLRQIRPFVTFDTLVTIYKSLILPFFDYCDVLWTNANKGGLDRLQKLQNRAARVITHASYDVRSRDLLKSLNWDNLTARRFENEMILMHKIMNDRAPQYLKSHFSRVRDSNHYDLRGRDTKLSLPLPKNEFIRKSFRFRAASRWNNLDDGLRSTEELSRFKRVLHTHCLSTLSCG